MNGTAWAAPIGFFFGGIGGAVAGAVLWGGHKAYKCYKRHTGVSPKTRDDFMNDCLFWCLNLWKALPSMPPECYFECNLGTYIADVATKILRSDRPYYYPDNSDDITPIAPPPDVPWEHHGPDWGKPLGINLGLSFGGGFAAPSYPESRWGFAPNPFMPIPWRH